MGTTEIKLYDIFRNDLKLSDAKAKVFAEIVNETISNEVKLQHTEFKSLLKEDLLKLEVKIAESKNDMIKWFFGFFVTLMLMILGLYATILLK